MLKLKKYFNIIPVCPEVFGGLPTPRTSSEICGDRVVSKDGVDVTAAFADGAEKTLYIAPVSYTHLTLPTRRSFKGTLAVLRMRQNL